VLDGYTILRALYAAHIIIAPAADWLRDDELAAVVQWEFVASPAGQRELPFQRSSPEDVPIDWDPKVSEHEQFMVCAVQRIQIIVSGCGCFD